MATTRWMETPNFCATIPYNTLPIILSYLDNLMEIHYLSTTCKSFRKAISNSTSLVVETAILEGSSLAMKQSMLSSIIHGKIYPPSNLRLLRCFVGKRCERGQYCVANDGPAKLKKNYRPFNLCICGDCAHAMAESIGIRSRKNKFASYVLEITETEGMKVIATPMVEEATGELIGPLITFEDIKDLKETANEEERKTCLEDKMNQRLSVKDRAQMQLYKKIYENAEEKYLTHFCRKQLLQEQKAQANKVHLASRKRENTELVLDRLKKTLEENGANEEEQAVVLKGFWARNSSWELTGNYYLDNWPSQLKLKEIFNAPSRARVKTIISGVNSALQIYRTSGKYVGNQGYDQLLSAPTNTPAHEKAMIEYICNNHTAEDLFNKFVSIDNLNYANKILEKLDPQGPKTNLEILEILFPIFTYDDLQNIFVEGVANNAKEATLAKRFWKFRNSLHFIMDNDILDDSRLIKRFLKRNDVQIYGEEYDECKESFESMTAEIRKYIIQPETKKWLADNTRAPDPDQTFSRMDAIETIYYTDIGTFDTRYAPFSLSSFLDFKKLLALHQSIFNDPVRYGYNPRYNTGSEPYLHFPTV